MRRPPLALAALGECRGDGHRPRCRPAGAARRLHRSNRPPPGARLSNHAASAATCPTSGTERSAAAGRQQLHWNTWRIAVDQRPARVHRRARCRRPARASAIEQYLDDHRVTSSSRTARPAGDAAVHAGDVGADRQRSRPARTRPRARAPPQRHGAAHRPRARATGAARLRWWQRGGAVRRTARPLGLTVSGDGQELHRRSPTRCCAIRIRATG